MPSGLLLAVYLAALALQIALTVRAWQGRAPWKYPLLLELGCIPAALVAMEYFNRLPGYGFMPGLTWLGHVLFSLGAAGAYGIMLILTAALCWWKNRK